MIQLVTLTASILFAYVFAKYILNVRLIVNDKERRQYWDYTLSFFAILILLFWFWLKISTSRVVAGCVITAVCFGLYNVNRYFRLQYSENEVKRRKEDKLMAAIRTSFDDSPLPYFFKRYDKDRDVFVTEYFNKAFVQIILKPSEKTVEGYMNSTDFEEWPADLAKDYDQQDRQVYFDGITLLHFDSKAKFGDFEGTLSWTKYKDKESGHLICFGNFIKL